MGTIRFCKNCKYFKEHKIINFSTCTAYGNTRVDPIDGTTKYLYSIYELRDYGSNNCGYSGTWFKAKQVEDVKPKKKWWKIW